MLKYNITGKNSVTVTMGIKPCQTPSTIEDDSVYRKQIPLVVDVTIKDLPADYDIKTIPDVIFQNFISSIKVDIQASVRGIVKTKDVTRYKNLYDALKTQIVKVQKFDVTLEIARKKAVSPETQRLQMQSEMLNTLSKGYPKQFAPKCIEIIAQFGKCTNADGIHDVAMVYATEWEKQKAKH